MVKSYFFKVVFYSEKKEVITISFWQHLKRVLKMQRITVLKRISATLQRRGFHDNVQKRYLATVKEVFPHKTDFPSRHIGPRKTEVVAMLDYIGYKVRIFRHFHVL